MMERILEQRIPLTEALQLQGKTDLLPEREKDWSIMGELVLFLKPFKVIVKFSTSEVFKTMTEHSSSDSVSVSEILPFLSEANNNYLVIRGDSDNLKEVKQVMQQDLVVRWNKYKGQPFICGKASALDPRFKKLEFLQQEYAASIWQKLSEEMTKLSGQMEEEVTASGSVLEQVSKKQKLHKDKMVLLFGRIGSTSQPQTIQATVQEQITLYKAEPQICITDDPLKWWRVNSAKYPLIAQLARQYLVIPATSAKSERTFSLTGQLVTPRRNCLGSERVDMLVFLNDFVRKQELTE